MKNFKARLAGILACLLLFIVPLQADAGWNASPLPAASIYTVVGDSTYLNPEWMTKKKRNRRQTVRNMEIWELKQEVQTLRQHNRGMNNPLKSHS